VLIAIDRLRLPMRVGLLRSLTRTITRTVARKGALPCNRMQQRSCVLVRKYNTLSKSARCRYRAGGVRVNAGSRTLAQTAF
jgi:hypothetical protein